MYVWYHIVAVCVFMIQGCTGQPLKESIAEKAEDLTVQQLHSATLDAIKFKPHSQSPSTLDQQVQKTVIKAKKISINKQHEENLIRLLKKSGGDIQELKTEITKGGCIPHNDQLKCPFRKKIHCSKTEYYRSLDGTCNNLKTPLFGSSFVPLRRLLIPDNADSQSKPRTGSQGELPSPRSVSLALHSSQDTPDNVHALILMTWGQFLDHDITLTALSTAMNAEGTDVININCGKDGCDDTEPECFPIPIPPNDPVYAGKKCLEFIRSAGVDDLQCTLDGPRQQLNEVTSYLDGSNVYGSTKKDADRLRTGKNGNLGAKLQTSDPPTSGCKRYLPVEKSGECLSEGAMANKCFKAGDARSNEQPLLTVMHTLWVREHNRIVDELQKLNPGWDDDKLYLEARKMVGAMLQHITYNEFLPVFIGENTGYDITLLSSGFYQGYDNTLDGTISNAFATAAYRVGHSLIPHNLQRYDSTYNPYVYPSVPLSQAFFKPGEIYNTKLGGVDAFIRGMLHDHPQSVDRFLTDQVTTFLFSINPPHEPGTDLLSLNIQRGRDHGLPGYSKWRSMCHLNTLSDFSQLGNILQDEDLAKKFKNLYQNPEDIDLFSAGLSEPRLKGGLLGETFACIIGREFENIRRGDRFWYERSGPGGFTAAQLAEIRKTTLAKVICNNSDNIDKIHSKVMYTTGKVVKCTDLEDIDFTKWQKAVY